MSIIKNLKNKTGIGVLSGSIILFVLLWISCVADKPKVELVRIFYLPKGLSVLTPIDSCDKIFNQSDILKDTIIKDKLFIENLTNILDSLKPAQEPDTNFDFRIRCVLKMKDGSKKVLCLGEYFDTVYEGKLYEDSSELFEMIKTTVYN